MMILLTHTACDLQPKIQNLPDSVGDFISARYPALLADPNENPEIYNSAATDYGFFASPDLYGHEESGDYVTYASVDDYVVPVQVSEYGIPPISESVKEVVIDTTDDYLQVPEYVVPEKKIVKKGNVTEDILEITKPVTNVKSVTRVELKDVRVEAGDTLYSLSRKYSVPVNDLAVINNLQAPFNLSVGQKLRVPDLDGKSENKVIEIKQKASVEKKAEIVKKDNLVSSNTEIKKDVVENKKEKDSTTVVATKKKISSNPAKKLPKIASRSSSKFSWPVRGKILSNYGAKSNGLFNDGINISASRGVSVVAAENGVVAYAGNEIKGMGNLVIVQHSDGWMTVYAHMDSMAVRRGTRVTVGQKIGTVGQTGKVDSPQLHFEIRKGTKAYNPTSYLKK